MLSQETELAKTDLAQRLSVAATALTVQSAQSVDWPDASLGCPQPGTMYAQVVTPGYRVILTYEAKEYGFHGGPAGPPFLCEREDTTEPPETPGATAGPQAVSSTPSPTISPSPSATPTPTPAATPFPTATATPSPRPTPTRSPVPAPTATAAPANLPDVQITCIFFDGAIARSESDEYVEIVNQGTAPQDLDGWALEDIADGRPRFVFPSSVLEPGAIVRVYTDQDHPEWGGLSFGSGSARPSREPGIEEVVSAGLLTPRVERQHGLAAQTPICYVNLEPTKCRVDELERNRSYGSNIGLSHR